MVPLDCLPSDWASFTSDFSSCSSTDVRVNFLFLRVRFPIKSSEEDFEDSESDGSDDLGPFFFFGASSSFLASSFLISSSSEELSWRPSPFYD